MRVESKTTAMESQVQRKLVLGLSLLTVLTAGVNAWTGEVRGRVVCDVCGDSSIGPEDHILEGENLKFSLSPFFS